MKYGKNNIEVIEVMEVFNALSFDNENVFFGEKYSVINDFEIAKSMAWENTSGVDELTWPDIKEDKMAQVWEAYYGMENYLIYEDVLHSEFNKMCKLLGKNISGKFREVIDEILADFQGCFYSRFVFGRANQFFEDLLEVYKYKGWPCGWSGQYPEGRIVVFAQL